LSTAGDQRHQAQLNEPVCFYANPSGHSGGPGICFNSLAVLFFILMVSFLIFPLCPFIFFTIAGAVTAAAGDIYQPVHLIK